MPASLYKPANQHFLLWLGIGLTGVAGQLLTLFGLNAMGWEKQFGFWIFLPSCLPFFAAIAFGVWLLNKFNRERVAGIAALLEPRGFLVSQKPSPETKGNFYPSMAGIFAAFGRDRGPEPIQWLAMTEPAGNRMALLEYEYTIGSGKFRQEYQLTVLAWPSSHPEFPLVLDGLPFVCLMKYPWWSRGVVRRNIVKVAGLETFQKEWVLMGDVDTARRLLTPVVIEYLQKSPGGEFWYLGQGWACAAYQSTLNAPNLQRFLDHAGMLLSLLKQAERRSV